MTQSYKLVPAEPYPLGMRVQGNDLIFSGVYRNTTGCGLVLYPLKNGKVDKDSPQTVPLTDSFRHGSVYSVCICNAVLHVGAYQLMSAGKRYADPYSKKVYGLEEFGKITDPSDVYSVIDILPYDWEKDQRPSVSYDKSFIYLLHVRGYTMADNKNVPSKERGTFAGLIRKIPYLKSLGVTAVEMMPIYEQPSILTRKGNALSHAPQREASRKHEAVVNVNGVLKDAGKQEEITNFWGFEKGYLFAPRGSYAMSGNDAATECKDMIKAFHEAGIEVIVQFYFPEDVLPMTMEEVLHYWVTEYHLDGIHLKGKNVNSYNAAKDPLFSDVKIFDYGFDFERIYEGVRVDPSKRNLAEYRDDFSFTMRHFLKGDDNALPDFLRLSQETGINSGCVHYICDYEGLRLEDLVSYEHKHNEENGENNSDGPDDNVSWNCGVEGKSRKKAVTDLRRKQIRNALVFLFLSQGVPMLFGGDEFGNSQDGNTNPYCQDNSTGWIDWKAFEKHADLVEYTRFLISLRKNYAVFRSPMPFRLMDYKACGYPDFSYHGSEAWRPDLSNYSHTIGMLYCGLYTGRSENHSYVYVAYNMHWEKKDFALPVLPKNCRWQLILDTAQEFDPAKEGSKEDLKKQESHRIEERSICVFVSTGDPSRAEKADKVDKRMPF